MKLILFFGLGTKVQNIALGTPLSWDIRDTLHDREVAERIAWALIQHRKAAKHGFRRTKLRICLRWRLSSMEAASGDHL